MGIVSASILFALPTSLFVCVTRGLNVLQGSSVVLVTLVAIPLVASAAILFVQAWRAPQRHPRRPAGALLAASSRSDSLRADFAARHSGLFERVEG